MKTNFTFLAAVTFVVIFSAAMPAVGQVAGDYQSSGSGNWNVSATWQTFDGSAWNAAVTPPPGTSGTITIQTGHTVTVTAGNPDTIKGASIVVNGYLKDQAYITFTSGSMTVDSGATYELAHPSNSGQGIPTATWKTGSTCLLTGITSSTTGINANQAFYNLTVNCPSWSGNLNLGWNSGTTNIAGNITVQNTGSGTSRWQFCAPAVGASDTLNIGGNLVIDGTASTASAVVNVTSNGTSNGSTTILINVAGNITVTGNPANNSYTNFSASRGSQGGSGTAVWNLYGNFSMSNATTQNSNATGAKFVFAKAGKQTMTLSGVAFSSGCPVEVSKVTTLSMGTSVLGGSGTFTADTGATLECGHSGGLDSTLSNSGVKTLSSAASYTFNGTSAQVMGSLMPTTVKNLTINNPAGVTLPKADTINGTLTLTSGILKIGTKNVIANATAGGSSTSYVATDSGGTLKVNGVGSTQTVFPVGISGGFAPVWITNTGAVDTITTGVVLDTLGGTKNSGGRVKVKWNIAENTPGGSNAALQFGWVSSLEDPVFSTNRSGNAKIFRLSDTTQVGTGSYTTQLTTAPYTVARGGVTAFGVFAVGNFTGFVAGDGDYRSHQSGLWSDVNTWERNNGTSWIYPAPSAPTWTDSTIAIQTGHTVEVSDSEYADQITINAGGTLKIDSAETLVVADGTGTDLTVLGSLVNAGTLTINSGATLAVASGGTYEHAQNGGTIPMATWSSGSLMRITGIRSATSFVGGADQNFYNVEWNCPNQTGNMSLGCNGDTLGGYFKVVNTNTGQLYLFNGSTGSVTINGDVTIQAGTFKVGSSSGDTVKHYGNISVTGGVFGIGSPWYLYSGNFSASGASIQGSVPGKIVFAKTGVQTLTVSSMIWINGGLPVEVSSGTTLNVGTSVLMGGSPFIVDPGATLECAHAGGLDSALSITGTKSLSKSANYIFNGLLPQATGLLLPDSVNNLTISDTLGVRLSSKTTVNGTLALVAGKFSVGSKNLGSVAISGVSTSRYIATDSGGTVTRYGVGAVQTLFPVGTAAAYSPVWITNSGTVDTFSVSVAPDSVGGTKSGNGRVKLKWNIAEKTPGGSNATLQFGWMASQEDTSFAASRTTNNLIVHLPDTAQVGTGIYTYQFTTQPYTLSRAGITSFGYFAIGRLGAITSVDDELSNIPKEYSLAQNYPNPFNPSTKIFYELPKESRVSLIVYDVLGREVAALVDKMQEPGSYTVTFSTLDGRASGVYFYRIHAGNYIAVKKMMLLK
ncbi:MAG: T9SS type A sorting domain-containing protein [Bacteroidota bacterium]